MINEINYISIKEVMARILNHPMLRDVTLEQAIRYTLDFIAKFGFNKEYMDKEVTLSIQEYRTMLPCDLIRINQIKNKDGLCFRLMTQNFIPNDKNHDYELTYKTQGRVLYTSIKCGDIELSYKAIPVDDDGFPLLIDNPIYLETLELYIKKQVFTILFDQGKINQAILNNTQQQYYYNAGQLQSEFNIPSVAEMESIKNNWCNMLQYNNSYLRDFRYSNYSHIKK